MMDGHVMVQKGRETEDIKSPKSKRSVPITIEIDFATLKRIYRNADRSEGANLIYRQSNLFHLWISLRLDSSF